MLLGVIADDFTGATDIAGFLVENGMRTIQLNGIPDNGLNVDADAVVISLKSRSCPVEDAVNESLSALQWLLSRNCQQFYFKYCSTFDSTAEGNIGPVTDALMSALGCEVTVVCPALPVNGRTVFNGHLFVLGELLNESGMRHHPVNPMTDSSLIRLMNQQSKGKAGLINYQQIEQGVEAIQQALHQLINEGKRYAVVDAFNSSHLHTLGAAVKNLRLVTGGSGLATGIAKNWVNYLEDQSQAKLRGMPKRQKTVILSGSCSEMTNRQVDQYKTIAAYFPVSVARCMEELSYSYEVSLWVKDHLDNAWAPIVYATASREELEAIQQTYGAEAASQGVEKFFSQLAHHLQEIGVQNFIVAGGETSGIVTQSLGVKGFHIGPQITPGVPWVRSVDQPLCLALKSGNFGDIDFFKKAQEFYHE